MDLFKLLSSSASLEKSNKINKTLEIAFHPATKIDGLPKEMSESRLEEYDFLKNNNHINALKKYNLVSYQNILKYHDYNNK